MKRKEILTFLLDIDTIIDLLYNSIYDVLNKIIPLSILLKHTKLLM